MKTSRDVGAMVAGLLEREIDAVELRESAGRAARDGLHAQSRMSTVFVFRLGSEWLALPPAVIDEVQEVRPIHGLPHRRSGVVRGIVGVRGRLTVLVSMEHLLHGSSAGSALNASKAARRLVVLVANGQRLAFEADEVSGNHRFDPAALRDAPATVSQASPRFTTDVLPVGEHSVGLLDAGLVLRALERHLG